jgi:hypothetical protein
MEIARLTSQKTDNLRAIPAEILQLGGNDIIQSSFINIPINMYKKVTESSHFLQFMKKTPLWRPCAGMAAYQGIPLWYFPSAYF